MKKSKDLKVPEGLSVEAKTWWKSLVSEYEIDDSAGFLLLRQALMAFDEVEAAKKILGVEGSVIKDRFGVPKQHPATLVLRDARNLMLRSLKALNLDVAPGHPLGGRS